VTNPFRLELPKKRPSIPQSSLEIQQMTNELLTCRAPHLGSVSAGWAQYFQTREVYMIHLLRASDLWLYPVLAASMFQDRRRQFKDRLHWAVSTDRYGFERDEYDSENPIYVIVSDESGLHLGSMRLLPTTGKTMINDVFLCTLGGTRIVESSTWECTRFCLRPYSHRQTAPVLLTVGAMIMRTMKIERLVAVYDTRMKKVYRRSGILPNCLGSHNYNGITVYSGFWQFSEAGLSRLLTITDINGAKLEDLVRNFGNPWGEHHVEISSQLIGRPTIVDSKVDSKSSDMESDVK